MALSALTLANAAENQSRTKAPSREALIAEIKQLRQQERLAEEQTRGLGSKLTDTQMADRIIRKEKIFIADQKITAINSSSEKQSQAQLDTEKEIANELDAANSSEERLTIVAKHRAYRQVMEKDEPRREDNKTRSDR